MAEPTLPPPECTYADHSYPAYSAKQMRAAIKATRALALEEAAKACEGEHITFLAARAIRALIGKEP